MSQKIRILTAYWLWRQIFVKKIWKKISWKRQISRQIARSATFSAYSFSFGFCAVVRRYLLLFRHFSTLKSSKNSLIFNNYDFGPRNFSDTRLGNARSSKNAIKRRLQMTYFLQASPLFLPLLHLIIVWPSWDEMEDENHKLKLKNKRGLKRSRIFMLSSIAKVTNFSIPIRHHPKCIEILFNFEIKFSWFCWSFNWRMDVDYFVLIFII